MKRVCLAHGLDYFRQKYTGSGALTFPDLPDLSLETSQGLTRIDAQSTSRCEKLLTESTRNVYAAQLPPTKPAGPYPRAGLPPWRYV